MSPTITQNVTVPPRTRTFTEDDARQVLALMKGEAEGQTGPAENVGFGEFDSPSAARGAGVTLNKLLTGLGAPHRYSVTTFKRRNADGAEKIVGVMLNKPAKDAPQRNGSKPAAQTAGSARRGRR